jgi:hypothetical protein
MAKAFFAAIKTKTSKLESTAMMMTIIKAAKKRITKDDILSVF